MSLNRRACARLACVVTTRTAIQRLGDPPKRVIGHDAAAKAHRDPPLPVSDRMHRCRRTGAQLAGKGSNKSIVNLHEGASNHATIPPGGDKPVENSWERVTWTRGRSVARRNGRCWSERKFFFLEGFKGNFGENQLFWIFSEESFYSFLKKWMDYIGSIFFFQTN